MACPVAREFKGYAVGALNTSCVLGLENAQCRWQEAAEFVAGHGRERAPLGVRGHCVGQMRFDSLYEVAPAPPIESEFPLRLVEPSFQGGAFYDEEEVD